MINTVKEFRLIYSIVGVSIILRSVLLYLLPSSYSSLGPDEGTYALLIQWTSNSLPVNEFPLYGSGLYYSARTFVWTGVLFNNLGFTPLSSARLTSYTYGILSILIFALILKKTLLDVNHGSGIRYRRLRSLFGLLVTVYSFVPSNLLWSVLGLREAAVQFWLLLTIFLFINLFSKFSNQKQIFFSSLFFTISMVLTYGTRPETALILSLSILLSLIFSSVRNNLSKVLMSGTLLLGIFLGNYFVTPPVSSQTKVAETNSVNTIQSNTLSSKLSSIRESEYRANVNRIGAASALPERICNTTDRSFESIRCGVVELPFRLTSVLFRPFPFVDSGTLFLSLAAIENIFWITAFSLYVYYIFRSLRFLLRETILQLYLVFILSYSAGMALFEGNLGTAFRHKSSLLGVLLLGIIQSFVINQSKKK